MQESIKQKELEDEYNQKTKETQEEITNMKTESAKEIESQRKLLAIKLQKISRRGLKSQRKLKNQLQNVRYEMAEKLSKYTIQGDIKSCQNAVKDMTNKLGYCQYKFTDSLEKLTQCQKDTESPSKFCETCCNAEFPSNGSPKYNDCMNTVCIDVIPDSNLNAWKWVNHKEPQVVEGDLNKFLSKTLPNLNSNIV